MWRVAGFVGGGCQCVERGAIARGAQRVRREEVDKAVDAGRAWVRRGVRGAGGSDECGAREGRVGRPVAGRLVWRGPKCMVGVVVLWCRRAWLERRVVCACRQRLWLCVR